MKKIYLFILAAMICTAGYTQSVTVALTQAPCNHNGILTATISGMTAPYDVHWGNITHTGVTGSTDVLNNYSGAPMYVYVYDANNQYAWTTFQGAPPFTYTTSITNAVCPAQGSATVTVNGGASPYTYSWTTNPGNTVVSTSNPASLPTGQYDITITDANGCVYGSKNTQDSITVFNQSGINFPITNTQANCTNGTATIGTISGGTPPYSILWSTTATTTSITGLTYGSYNATVTDAQGCSTTKYTYVSQSKNIGTNVVATPATCLQNDGAVTSFGSGGTPPYSYLWNNSATTSTQTGLPAGYYSVKVTDANGCTGNGGGTVTASTPINVTYTTMPSSCTTATGSAQLSITGGATPYAVQWFTTGNPTGMNLIQKPSGTYSFRVTDANGCVRNGTVYIPPVSILNVSLSGTDANCTQSNGSASVNVTGGTAPYTYSWSNSATTPSITGLSAGYYSVTVTDNIGCSVKKSRSVKTLSPVNVGINSSNTSCIFSSNGTATAVATGGTAPYSYTWSNGGSGANINNLPTGGYRVYATDANGCKGTAYANIGYNPNNNSCYCIISGVVYDDANNSCTQDAGEQGIANIQIHCSGIGYAYTDANGYYSFKVPSGSYTVTQSVQAYYPLASCQNNGIAVNATAGANCTHTVDFANNTATIHDMHVQTWNFTCPVPGYVYKQRVIFKNKGTVSEPVVYGGYNTDGQISVPTFSPSGYFSGSGNQYNISGGSSLSLAPGQSRTFDISYTMPTNIPLNTQLVFKDTTAYSAPVSNWLTDYSPWNNVDYYTPHVVGSYDPNFKEVSPVGVGPTGIITRDDSTLEYMIHFQNLGTHQAYNIYILDTLDADLDWATMTPVYQSHPCVITMDENGVIRFQFDNINLPAEQDDEPGSHGMVSFHIKTKGALPLGTQFHNTAAIYFDFNEPVITNTTVNTLGELSVEETLTYRKGEVSIYPNPTHDVFTIQIKDGSYGQLKVINTMGQLITASDVNGDKTVVSLANATPGVYFVILEGSNGYKVEKVEKL